MAGRSSIRHLATGMCLACVIGACGGTTTPLPREPRPQAAAGPAGPTGPQLSGPVGLPAQLLPLPAAANDEAPLLVARRGDDGVLLTRRDRRWISLAFEPRGSASDDDEGPTDAAAELRWQELAPAPSGELRAALAAAADGYLAAWAMPRGGHREIHALPLGRDGSAQGQPQVTARVVEPVRWIEVLQNKAGALILWEVERDGSRDLWVAPWRSAGPKPRPTPVVRDVLAWHAAPSAAGAVFVSVTGASTASGTPTGRVELREIAEDGTVAPPLTLCEQETALPDAQVVTIGNRYVVAWTDTRPLMLPEAVAGLTDPHVYVATVEQGTRKVLGPALAQRPIGPQALVGLVAHEQGSVVLLAWEPQRSDQAHNRRVHLATLKPAGSSAGPRAELVFDAHEDTPHFAATTDGFVAVTLAPPVLSEAAAESEPPFDNEVVPTFVRFDTELEVMASEPVRVAAFGESGIPRRLQATSCHGERCSVLAGGGEPAKLALVDLAERASPWQAAAATLPIDSPPRPEQLGMAAVVDAPLAATAATKLAAGRTLVAWITHVAAPPGPRKRALAAQEATLGYRLIEADGTYRPVVALSQRAISLGGVDAVAAAPSTSKHQRKSEAAAVLAWVAPNNGDPQVFVTQIGADGSKQQQRAVTRARRNRRGAPEVPNEVSDVDITADGRGGYLVAWTDTRDGNAEIYVARLNERLERKGSERRISRAPGASTEPRLAAERGRVWLVWSDAREQAEDGLADVYLAILDPDSLEKRAPEQRLARTPAHSRTPGLTLAPQGAVAWWIEQPTTVGTTGGGGGRVLHLDGSGQPRGPSVGLAPAGRQVTSILVGCREQRCRGAVASTAEGALQLDIFSLPNQPRAGRQTPFATKSVARLTGGGGQDVELAAASGSLESLFFVATGAGGHGLVRHLRLAW